MEASTNPTLESIQPDPTLVCTAYKKSRFYLFSKREPDDLVGDQDRYLKKLVPCKNFN